KLIKASVMEYLSEVSDPRIDRTRAHPLVNVLVIALLAVLCGADSFAAIERFGNAKKELLATFLDLEHGIPSHDTFGRVFAALDPTELQDAFRAWVASLVEVSKGEVVAIDGKTLRRSFRDAGRKAFVHMVSAWAASNRVVLGQLKTDDKSDEITAIPKLLDLLKLKGATVTIDAMGCQKHIAQKLVSKGADYMLAVKENQPTVAAARLRHARRAASPLRRFAASPLRRFASSIWVWWHHQCMGTTDRTLDSLLSERRYSPSKGGQGDAAPSRG